jgi:hypothetical protein
MNPETRMLRASCLLGVSLVAAMAQAGTPVTWTITTSVIGPASLVGHGHVEPASATVNNGDTATFTFTPDPGYVLAGTDIDAGCGGSENSDGTWTTTPIFGDCQIDGTFALSAADVVFQGDFDPNVKIVDDVNLGIPPTVQGASINWQTGATCVGAFGAACDDTYHFRLSSNSSLNGVLVFRFPTLISPDTYGVVSQTVGEDAIFSPPLVDGATIGPDQNFDYPVFLNSASDWCTADGVDAYVGFRFLNSNSGLVNYGYAHLQTGPESGTSPCGFPATIVGYAYDRRGNAIVIP